MSDFLPKPRGCIIVGSLLIANALTGCGVDGYSGGTGLGGAHPTTETADFEVPQITDEEKGLHVAADKVMTKATRTICTYLFERARDEILTPSAEGEDGGYSITETSDDGLVVVTAQYVAGAEGKKPSDCTEDYTITAYESEKALGLDRRHFYTDGKSTMVVTGTAGKSWGVSLTDPSRIFGTRGPSKQHIEILTKDIRPSKTQAAFDTAALYDVRRAAEYTIQLAR